MPDIAKCRGGNCPLRDSCYRFLADDSEHRQAYLSTVPYGLLHANYCEMFAPIELFQQGDGSKELKT